MIYDASTFELPMRIKADLCVVGSGAGGSAAAARAAAAGLSVVVLEAGGFVPPETMTQREEDMLPALLVANGSQKTQDRGCTIVQGRALGGSTVHNLNLCKRIPDAILAEWHADRTLGHLPAKRWRALYDEVERRLDVSPIPPSRYNRHNLLLQQACQALGWAGGGLSHNRTGCIGSGFCEVGCAYDAKNNAVKVFVPQAIDHGAQFVTHCRAVTIDHDDRRVRGVRAAAVDRRTGEPVGEVYIEAPRVCLSASATGTPAILLRSEVPDPSGETGKHLRVHPAVVIAGEFDEPVRAWKGIPQAYECTEFLDFDAAHPGADADAAAKDRAAAVGSRTWIIPAFAHPVATATMLPGWGAEHRKMMDRYDRLGVLTAMIHDRSGGTVEPDGDFGVQIDYWPNAADRRELSHGLVQGARLLFAAGARKVHIPTWPARSYETAERLGELERLELTRGLIDLTAVHPMGTVRMGDDPRAAAVDSRGKHHHIEGLWVADGSLFPTSIGVPPQLSIYAMGLHVGDAIAATA